MRRVVANFSCGAASACAWKLAVDKYGDDVVAINAFIADEDTDNRRFLADCEQWIGRKVTVLRDEKYGASPAEVWRKHLDQLPNFVRHVYSPPDQPTLHGQILSPNIPTSRPRLNPAFVCWLMGWPWWWTRAEPINCAAPAMESYRSKLQSHLSILCGG